MATPSLGQDLLSFFISLFTYFKNKILRSFRWVEAIKSSLAAGLYQQRGRLVRPFVHSGMAFLIIGGMTLGPVLIAENLSNPWREESPSATTLTVAMADTGTATLISQKPRAETIEYKVEPGDTISTIAEKFGVSVDTIIWENNLKSVKDIKSGQTLRILPVTGVLYKVKPGETIYTIAKKLQVDPQVVVDWPYNSFANDETFALAVGQSLIIPDGIKPKETPLAPKRLFATIPGAGLGTGQFVWPVGGTITQNFSWYHPAVDIANRAAPDIVAADGGTVIVTGWPTPWDYGNRIMINHGNGQQTLYAHLSQIYVSVGQKVARGQTIGKMGSTGRSTGTHLHFEIRTNGAAQNPLN
ncbi:MAG: M23 family metallopeptidase, partial [Candidatus Shapirobacteria bacterium]|nr:M23 family metallopeptidase [Candidatus Shapirobacteria bacterium]